MVNHKLREQVLDACRGLAAQGLGPGIGGHVSVRVPGEPLFYSNAFDKCFEEMTIDDILLLDFDGNVIDSNKIISQGLTFHHGIYKQRPDVGAIVHSHGFWITAQAAFGRPPRMLHNLCTYFYERTCVSPNDDFDAIGKALGPQHNTIIIPWHGAITVGKDIAEAAALLQTFDFAARLDVTVPAHAPEMPHHMCFEMRALVERANYLNLTWDLIRRKGRDAFDGHRVIPRMAA
jgi:L-fuculose-phosphate aldolase